MGIEQAPKFCSVLKLCIILHMWQRKYRIKKQNSSLEQKEIEEKLKLFLLLLADSLVDSWIAYLRRTSPLPSLSFGIRLFVCLEIKGCGPSRPRNNLLPLVKLFFPCWEIEIQRTEDDQTPRVLWFPSTVPSRHWLSVYIATSRAKVCLCTSIIASLWNNYVERIETLITISLKLLPLLPTFGHLLFSTLIVSFTSIYSNEFPW